jgi:DNA end-binding protein Ku
MAAIWKGTISFGLVTIPVELQTAVRSDRISFRQLHAEDFSPIRYQRVSQESGEEVPWGEIVKGYEVEKGKFVVLTDEDFEAAKLESSRQFEILDFVEEDAVDPRFFETPYYLTPAKGGEKAYALLREAMRNKETVAIGKIMIRQKQHLAGIKVVGDALVMEIMRFGHELVDATEYRFPAADNLRPAELQMAEQLVDSLTEEFSPDKYTDEYRENLMKIIRAKAKGEQIETPSLGAPPQETKVVDLMARLRESLEAREGGGASRGSARTGRKTAASRQKTARKSSAKKTRGRKSA